jgi:hypothetical protein
MIIISIMIIIIKEETKSLMYTLTLHNPNMYFNN